MSENNVSYMNNCVYLKLDISIWTGKARLTPEDIPDAVVDMPPEALATLGSKRIFDPQALRPFNTAKTRAFRTCDQYGVRCMGGWLVDNGVLNNLTAELDKLRGEFDYSVGTFISTYEDGASNWLQQFPEWEGIIRAALPDSTAIGKKFAFRYYVLKVQTENYDAQDATTSEAPSTAAATIAAEIARIREQVFGDDRTTPVTSKTFCCLDTLADRCDNMSFVHPDFAHLAHLLRSIVVNSTGVDVVRAFLTGLSTPEAVAAVTQETRIYDFEKDSLDMPEPAAPVDMPEPAAPVEKPEPAAPVVTSQPTAADDSLAALLADFI